MSGKQFNLDGKCRDVMKTILIIFTFIITIPRLAYSAPQTMFLKKTYGQIHQNASRISRIITTFECGQPLKVVRTEEEFSFVTYANYEGFIYSSHLVSDKPKDCYQDKYRKYFEELNLGISDMHYWAKLQDLLIEGSSMP